MGDREGKTTGLKRRAALTLCALCLCGLVSPLEGRENDNNLRDRVPEALYLNRVFPADRLGAEIRNQELNEHKLYIRELTLRLFAEYAFNEYVSVHGYLPHTKRWETDADTRTHINNINLGVGLQNVFGNFHLLYGADIFLATGDDEARIGSKLEGNLELRGGGAWLGDEWALGGTLRWNTQTNNRFRESEERPFERAWLVEFWGAWRVNATIELLLEFQREFRYNPTDRKLHTSVLAPGVNVYILERLLVGLSVPYTTSLEKRWDHGVIFRIMYLY